MTIPAVRDDSAMLETVLVQGDLARLEPAERLAYYRRVCESIGLNPLTKPFDYIVLNDRLTLYATRTATDQLRAQHKVSVEIISREVVENVYVVTAKATMPDGRVEESIGAVPLVKEAGEWKTSQNNRRYFAGNGTYIPLPPDDRANAMMKSETKAKRRVTLSIVGLGWLDESELETIASATKAHVDQGTGEITEAYHAGTGLLATTEGEHLTDAPAGTPPPPPPPQPRVATTTLATRFWAAVRKAAPKGTVYSEYGHQWLQDVHGTTDFALLSPEDQERAVNALEDLPS